MEYTHFCNDRKKFLFQRYCKKPNIIKFNELMNSKWCRNIKSIVKFFEDNYKSCWRLFFINLQQIYHYSYVLVYFFLTLTCYLRIYVYTCKILYLMYQWSGLWANKELKLTQSNRLFQYLNQSEMCMLFPFQSALDADIQGFVDLPTTRGLAYQVRFVNARVGMNFVVWNLY